MVAPLPPSEEGLVSDKDVATYKYKLDELTHDERAAVSGRGRVILLDVWTLRHQLGNGTLEEFH